MNGKTLIIRSLQRFPSEKPTDRLDFHAGVNLIFGERDAGKTVWLRMMDFLMADTGTPEEAFGDEIAEKYDSIQAVFSFSDGSEMTVERKWKAPGALHKIFVDGTPIDCDTFGDLLLKKLDIPIIHFPKGNPYSDRAWPKLSWRTLFRSIYRQERFWAKFVDQQPEGELAATILQFLGMAEKHFPQSYGALVEKRKRLQRLEGEREAHASVLHSITSELLQQKELSVAVTKESLESTRKRIKSDIEQLELQRKRILENIREEKAAAYDSRFQELKAERERLQQAKDKNLRELGGKTQRLPELRQYAEGIEAEISRLRKATTAGALFSDLRVTHCPACEQSVEDTGNTDVCYVCKRATNAILATPEDRVNFELDQLTEEFGELQELINKTEADISATESEVERLSTEIRKVDTDLNPAFKLVLDMIPPDLGILDANVGRLNEQLDQLVRVEGNLQSQDQLSDTISKLEKEIIALKTEIDESSVDVDFEKLSERLEDGMNSYLNALNKAHANRWSKGKLNVTLTDRAFKVTIGGAPLSAQLGAASHAIVLFSYHYALLKLSADVQCNYPGLVIVDFPLTLADGESLKDAENYLVEPFIQICSEKSMVHTQVIAAGRSFENLDGAHQILLSNAY